MADFSQIAPRGFVPSQPSTAAANPNFVTHVYTPQSSLDTSATLPVTVGVYSFRMSDAYIVTGVFSNGLYMNIGKEFRLVLNRPLSVVDGWQDVLRNLIGQKVIIKNLLQGPFEVFVDGESTCSMDQIELKCHSRAHDGRGKI